MSVCWYLDVANKKFQHFLFDKRLLLQQLLACAWAKMLCRRLYAMLARLTEPRAAKPGATKTKTMRTRGGCHGQQSNQYWHWCPLHCSHFRSCYDIFWDIFELFTTCYKASKYYHWTSVGKYDLCRNTIVSLCLEDEGAFSTSTSRSLFTG